MKECPRAVMTTDWPAANEASITEQNKPFSTQVSETSRFESQVSMSRIDLSDDLETKVLTSLRASDKDKSVRNRISLATGT